MKLFRDFREKPDKPGVKREGSLWVHRDGDERGSTVEQAKAFLASVLRDGPLQASAVRAEAWQRGISEATLRRAKKAHGVVSRQTPEGWVWALPDEQGAQADAHPDAQADIQGARADAQADTEAEPQEQRKPLIRINKPIGSNYSSGLVAWTLEGHITFEESQRRKGYTN